MFILLYNIFSVTGSNEPINDTFRNDTEYFLIGIFAFIIFIILILVIGIYAKVNKLEEKSNSSDTSDE